MTLPAELSDQIARLGKGMVQLNMRLGQVLEAIGRMPADSGSDRAVLEVLLDLADAAGEALGRRDARRGARTGWLGRLLAGREEHESLWRGLAMAREAALERLRALGIEPVAETGAFDPELHCAVEARPAPAPELAGRLAATHRRGWLRAKAGGREVLRVAQVSVYQEERG